MTEIVPSEKASQNLQNRLSNLADKYEKEEAAQPAEPEPEEATSLAAEVSPLAAEVPPPDGGSNVTPPDPDAERIKEFEKVSKAQASIRSQKAEIAQREEAFRQQSAKFEAERPLLERIQRAKSNPVEFLDLLEEFVPADKAAEFFMKAGTPRDRDRARIEQRLDEERQARLRLERTLQENWAKQQQSVVVDRVHQEFLSVAERESARFPRVARLPRGFLIDAANAKADELDARGVEWGYLDVLREIEEETSSFLKHFQDPAESASTEDKQPTQGRKATAPLRNSVAGESNGAGTKPKESRDERIKRLRRQFGE